MNKMLDKVQATALEAVMDYVLKNPAKNFPKLVDWAERFDVKHAFAGQISVLRPIAEDPDNTWNRFAVKLCEEIDHDILKATIRNFFINATMTGMRKQAQSRELYDCNVPWAILMDPTSACNLKCTGCWAAEYGNRLNMSYEELDSIICQANELGTYMFLYSGGEPLVRKKDIIRLCEAHPDCQFTSFTNGTLIDEAFAEEMLRVKNFIPAICTVARNCLFAFFEGTASKHQGLQAAAKSAGGQGIQTIENKLFLGGMEVPAFAVV